MICKVFEYEGRKEYEREYSPPPDDILDEYLNDEEDLDKTVELKFEEIKNETKQVRNQNLTYSNTGFRDSSTNSVF